MFHHAPVLVLGIGIGIGQYYWVLGALFGIVLTLVINKNVLCLYQTPQPNVFKILCLVNNIQLIYGLAELLVHLEIWLACEKFGR